MRVILANVSGVVEWESEVLLPFLIVIVYVLKKVLLPNGWVNVLLVAFIEQLEKVPMPLVRHPNFEVECLLVQQLRTNHLALLIWR